MVDTNALLRSVTKNRTNMKRVNVLAESEIRTVFSVANQMEFKDQAKLVRTAMPVIVGKYGNIATNIAAIHYNEYRSITAKPLGLPKYSAVAKTGVDFTERISNMMDIGIAKNVTMGLSSMEGLLIASSIGILSDYNRDTISFNAENDSGQVVKIQRVAGGNACAFCAQMAVVSAGWEGIVYDDNVISLETDYHDGCTCTSEVIYEGQAPLRPDHYDAYEGIYQDAYDTLSEERDAAFQSSDMRWSDFLKANPQYSVTSNNISSYMRKIGSMK